MVATANAAGTGVIGMPAIGASGAFRERHVDLQSELTIKHVNHLGWLQLTVLFGVPREFDAYASGGVVRIQLLRATHDVPRYALAIAAPDFAERHPKHTTASFPPWL
jgi:hypothetical protein